MGQEDAGERTERQALEQSEGKNHRENPEVPPQVAAALMSALAWRGHRLALRLESLGRDLERVFESFLVRYVPPRYLKVGDGRYDFHTGLGCYLGQTLCEAFGGKWKGHLNPQAEMNFYTSYLRFGEYDFRPFTYVLYRRSNGRSATGSVEELLAKILPSVRDGVDYKEREIRKLIGEGRLVVDALPWV